MGNANSIGKIWSNPLAVEKLDKPEPFKDKSEICVNADHVDIYYSTKHAMMINTLIFYFDYKDVCFIYRTKDNKIISKNYQYTRFRLVLDKEDSLNIKTQFNDYIDKLDNKFNIKFVSIDNKYKIYIPRRLLSRICALRFIEGCVAVVFQKKDNNNSIDIYQSDDKILVDIKTAVEWADVILDSNFNGSESELRYILDKVMYRVLELSTLSGDM